MLLGRLYSTRRRRQLDAARLEAVLLGPRHRASAIPVVYYDIEHSKWVATFLASGCGGPGIGVSVLGPTGSPGRSGPAPTTAPATTVSRAGSTTTRPAPTTATSTRAGTTSRSAAARFRWPSRPTAVSPGAAAVTVNSAFIRDVQITTGPNGYVYIAAMNEGGGGLGGPRTNVIYRSTNGGATWTSSNTGPTFLGPGVSTCGYFAAMHPSFWRHMGWGDIQTGPANSVHGVYAQHGAGADNGRHLLRPLDRQRRPPASAPLRSTRTAARAASGSPRWGSRPKATSSPAGTTSATRPTTTCSASVGCRPTTG